MKERKSYFGTLNGVKGIWTDIKPADLVLEKEITFYSPDKGKALKKDNEIFFAVVLNEGEKIEDYQEVDYKPEEESK